LKRITRTFLGSFTFEYEVWKSFTHSFFPSLFRPHVMYVRFAFRATKVVQNRAADKSVRSKYPMDFPSILKFCSIHLKDFGQTAYIC
jgi:hypothetical protein